MFRILALVAVLATAANAHAGYTCDYVLDVYTGAYEYRCFLDYDDDANDGGAPDNCEYIFDPATGQNSYVCH